MRISRLRSACAALLLCYAAQAQTVAEIETAADAPSVEALITAPIARFSARLAYNTDGGAVAGVGFGTDRLFGREQTLQFNAELQENRSRLSLFYEKEAIFGTSPTFGLQLLRAETRAGNTYDFGSSITRIKPRLTWQVSPSFRAATYLSYAVNEIENVPATSSILIRTDEGDQEAGALGIDLDYNVPIEPVGALRMARFSFGAEAGSTSHDHDYIRLTATAQTLHALANGNVVLRSQLRFGAISSQSGTSSIGDRFMLGQASIRGFEFGGFGPRDLAADGSPALGGNSYGIGRFDMLFPNAINGGESRLTPGVFMDFGSLWCLDDVAGGVAGADTVDDRSNLRAAIGLSMQIDTGIGPIQIYVAHPVAEQDYDRTQTFGLSLSHSF